MSEEFSINQIIELLLPKWLFIAISTLLIGVLAFLYSSYMIEPTYVASGTLYITGNVNISAENKQNTNLSDLMLSQELAKTYGEILSSNTFFKDVAKQSRTGYTYEQLQHMTSITNVEDTGLLLISVNHGEPGTAYRIANTILELAPEEIARVVVSGSATIIDPAEMPKSPASPSIPRNTVVGAMIGFVLSVGVVLLQYFFDKTIKSAEEIKEVFGLSVLGTIPSIEPKREREGESV